MAHQIDNLECSYVALNSMINSKPANGTINVMALFDNEEIGSRTRQGADSNLLDSTLKRIANEFNLSESEYSKALASSFFISMDNAQGFHPNYASKYDQTNRCYMNDGVVIKAAARGSYTSDGYSIAIFKLMCENSDAKYQFMTNRSDIPGGGTLGAINLSHLSIPSVDIGFAQIAMHSSMETAGALDIVEMEKVIKYFYSRHLIFNGDGKVVI
jgi:aspartyl aminopeptidase